MALQKEKYSKIPEDAVILTEDQALIYQTKLMANWPNTKDVFGFKYGSMAIATASMVTGIYFNQHFRGMFRLLNYGQMSSYLPITAIPTAISLFSHQQFVLGPLLLDRKGCPICLQTRASAIQALCGCLLPLVLSPITSLALVHRYHTYDMPYITKEPRKAFQVIAKVFKPIKNVTFYLFLGHAFLASLVTYFEADSINTVDMKLALAETEEEFRN
ncbi:unnamed protein product [Diabrotica balteata]|uniref:Transmembrane protein 126A n=1 Tax=Diabrotica balteata TaxID=107213 RepID=A0A9N9T9F5_DIABA|nr:unnamed protein product [Diabrotica balteata]